jgi:hypothetical protein
MALASPPPQTLVVFGASGDLARRKFLPGGPMPRRIAAGWSKRPQAALKPAGGETGYGQPMRSYSRAHAEAVLSPPVIVWRAAHGLIAAGFLAAIGYVWWCGLTGRRGRLLRPVIAVLAGEGVLVVANGGDCPLGGLGDRIGDPVPLFELVLSPRAARRAVPALGALTAVGVGVLAARSGTGGAARLAVVSSSPPTDSGCLP